VLSKLGEGVLLRPRPAAPPPGEVEGWLSERHPPRKLDRGVEAKRAWQERARHCVDGRGLDPVDLPQHLFAATAPATIELVQAVTEHARACKGSFMPRANKVVTHGLVAAFTFECSKYQTCTWSPLACRQYGAHGDDNAFANDDGEDVDACEVCRYGGQSTV
jgi:hypothetical protein